MALTHKELEKVARLARLGVDAQALVDLAEDVNQILAHVDRLNDQRIDACQPMSHPLDQSQYLRPDEVTESNQRESLMAGAPAQDQGLFLVPKVIE
ncbi:MAG TPA: Asp-tRNA(Asn)/Glu-tRNA(Gln) amidotransferase subunit GatC [Halothiobacillaceae bacterium]|nr:Asp-tRNA(Asn)/Glu-tRNA(Gln) amidotransferase subunit GatC [Halothiobacillaceae bacterium]